jgi:XTP/dITP diphosphohydrolase
MLGQPRRVVLATGNAGKRVEMQSLLGELPIDLIAQSHWRLPKIEETGITFLENALLKARQVARVTGLPAIADDSGILVDALGGAPGIFSARYAGAGASDVANLNKLLADAAGIPAGRRQCRFYCVVVYLAHADDPCPEVCAGRWHGELLFAPRGANGFGYDPVFFLPDRGCTSAELPPEVKNAISHRAQAVTGLARRLRESWLDA